MCPLPLEARKLCMRCSTTIEYIISFSNQQLFYLVHVLSQIWGSSEPHPVRTADVYVRVGHKCNIKMHSKYH